VVTDPWRNDDCPIARTVWMLSGRWTFLVIRQLFYGQRRFEQIQRSLDISRATLSDRLEMLETEGLVERRPYHERPVRHEYRLTEKGRQLWPVLAAMWTYGSDWMFDAPTPGMLIDPETGDEIVPLVIDASTGEPVDLRRTRLVAREA
jgi:DNA-binding HxlR family transcriptional regulator